MNALVNKAVTPVQTMMFSGLLQGFILLGLHEWFSARGFVSSYLVWAAPIYTLAILGPITFNFLRNEFALRDSLSGALISALTIALTAAWFGWSAVSANEADLARGDWAAGVFVFGFASLAVWFVSLPFLQSRLRHGNLGFPYEGLFADAWRNWMLVANCLVFTGVFWLLLVLWAGLFAVLKINFFSELFRTTFFVYLATAMAVSFAVSLEEQEASALTTLRRHLLAFQTRLLPLASLIVLLFLMALPFSGVQPLWDTGHATSLMLSLQLAMIVLTNAAWQDGRQPVPFSAPTQWLVKAALMLLPVLAALCIWAMYLRIHQYGWTVDRVWASVLVGLTTLYAAGYSFSALQAGWISRLGQFNTWIALILVAAMLAIHTPILDPQRIAASSQVARLLSGQSDASRFDYDYLRFQLGRSGTDALKQLSTLADHPKAEIIKVKARESLEKTHRYNNARNPAPSQEQLIAKVKLYPEGAVIDPGFIDYLGKRMEKSPYDYELNALRNSPQVVMLAVDLGKDAKLEYVLLSHPYPVFAWGSDGWQQLGQFNFSGTYKDREAELESAAKASDFAARPRAWGDLQLGTHLGTLQLHKDEQSR